MPNTDLDELNYPISSPLQAITGDTGVDSSTIGSFIIQFTHINEKKLLKRRQSHLAEQMAVDFLHESKEEANQQSFKDNMSALNRAIFTTIPQNEQQAQEFAEIFAGKLVMITPETPAHELAHAYKEIVAQLFAKWGKTGEYTPVKTDKMINELSDETADNLLKVSTKN
ncbi:hypothetical protein KBC03_02835 [Patescibacteria group bacterium]|nr:hypothetical protein [Patescibacteria group bacterium]